MRFFKPFEHPEIPTFPDYQVSIKDFGAKDGEDAREAIRAAIDHVAESGGGRVVIPKGRYLTGPIHFKSGVELHLEEGALVEFSEKFEDYLPVDEMRAGVAFYTCKHRFNNG